MKKKLFWMFGIIMGMLLILSTAATVSADTIVTGPNYIAGTDVYWHITIIDATYETRLTIAGSGEIPFYDSSNDTPWAAYRSNITELKVENGITGLGTYCFANMINLYTADLGDTVQDIAPYVFANCTTLKHVYLPDDLYTFYEGAFYNCRSLTNVTLAATNYYYKIENGIMTDSDGKYIYWGGGITGDEYYIPPTVTNIAASAFPVPMTTKIYVPDTVTDIAIDGFRSDHNVCGVAGSAIEEYMTDPFIDGELAESYNGMCGPTVFYKLAIKASMTGGTAALTIKGEGGTNDYTDNAPAPWNNIITTITNITVQGNVTSLGTNLFKGGTRITSVSLPSTIKTIKNYCFYGCTSLASVNIPASVTSIGTSAFENCTSLATVTLPDSLQYIMMLAFKNTALTTVDIPDSVYTIYSGAFANCNSLTSINVSATDNRRSSENGVVFNKNKTSLEIYPAGKTDETYYVPNSVTTINTDCYGSANLKHVYIPKNTANIANGAFSACSGLTIYGYTGSNAESFATNNNITFVAMDGTIENSDIRWTYDYKTQTLTISGSGEIPGTPKPWETWKTETKTIVIEENITDIGVLAFSGTANLETIYLPTTLTAIKKGAFYYSTTVNTHIIYAGTEDEWDNVSIDVNNQPITNATISFGQILSITSIAVGPESVFVSTDNIDDGRQIIIAAYTAEGKFISMNYVTITNNIGQLNVSTEGWGKAKAFYMNVAKAYPYCDAKMWTT